MIGRLVSHYRLTEKLGEGGMGVVYKARDTLLERFVALTFLPREQMSEAGKLRFFHEARASSALNHPNIISVYDIVSVDDADIIVMEYVLGKTLTHLVSRKGLKIEDTLRYAVEIADALATAHAAGIVHRDLKPANIIVTDQGRVKLLDFGIAKLIEPEVPDTSGPTESMSSLTEEGKVVGTVAYMSPEQAEGKKVDSRSDIFSLGSLLYEMHSGRQAFTGKSKFSCLSQILNKDPAPLTETIEGTPPHLDRIVARCLKKDRRERWQSVLDLKHALEDLQEEITRPTLVETRAKQSWLRGLWPIVGTVSIALAVTYGIMRTARSEALGFQRLTLAGSPHATAVLLTPG